MTDYEYFRAPTDTAALEPGTTGQDGAVFSWFVDPTVVVGQLVAGLRGVPWSTGLVRATMLSPDPATQPRSEQDWEGLPEDSPWLGGPFLHALPEDLRDELATAGDDRLPDVAAGWAATDGFSGLPDPHQQALTLLTLLVGLARTARDHGDRLYCRSVL